MQSPSASSRVRCLGWENLDFTHLHLSTAIVQTLNEMSVPHETLTVVGETPSSWVCHPRQPDSALPDVSPAHLDELPPLPLQAASIASDYATPPPPPPPAARHWDDEIEERSMLSWPLSPDLRVAIQIFAAGAENAGKHHIRLRRTQGGHWRFHAFYAEFRRALCSKLGLSDERQLSLYSPMQPKRDIDHANTTPAAGWQREPTAFCSPLASPPPPPSHSPGVGVGVSSVASLHSLVRGTSLLSMGGGPASGTASPRHGSPTLMRRAAKVPRTLLAAQAPPRRPSRELLHE